METGHGNSAQGRGAALNSLAIVGFIALIIIGILATIYAASFIPKMFSSSGSQSNGATAYLSTPTPDTSTTVSNMTQSTTETTQTTPVDTTATQQTTQTATNPVTTIYKYITIPSGGTTASYYGTSDLAITIVDRGYFLNGVFISSTYVPTGYQGAVKYRVLNSGTNVSGSYRVDIWVNTPSGTDTDSVTGSSIAPGGAVQGTGNFDSPARGTATIRLTVVSLSGTETNTSNNTVTSTISLGGSSSSGTAYDGSHENYDSNGNYCVYGTYYSFSRYYCKTSSYGNGSFDSDGNYCPNGTYSSGGRTYCDTYGSSSNNRYDSNGNYCSNGTYYSNGRYYCQASGTYNYDRNSGDTNWYDSYGRYCVYGTYYSGGRYYCNDIYNYNSNNNGCWYDQNGYQVCS